MLGRRGVYPGSFNPPTTAHLAISQAALDAYRLDEVVWSVSRVALAKEQVSRPRFEDRLEVLESVAQRIEWLRVAVTDAQLLVDIAVGYDVLIMGADKWHQIQDPIFYQGDPARRDAAMAALPTCAVAPRPPLELPEQVALQVPEWTGDISSSSARAGAKQMMLEEAIEFDRRTGAWSNDERYERWLLNHTGEPHLRQT